ncbi:uncharacterized protein LOC122363942 [Amphibalanus amphitrite]|uniref:uncharacterized protein LOC122363942 n=1 Tax=Amphibalanus amphitrite TaxID=1232801 RepID=UPI001C90E96A|nr:uncharacterized protein LOC122363942 [Amphibalanus amphitrite]
MDQLDIQRYQKKLICDGVRLPDPLSVPDGDWKADLCLLPKVTFPDIYVYLINSEGSFTSENLKAYKSLASWDLFKSGHVGKLEVFRPGPNLKFIRCEVRASQKASVKYLTWVLCSDDGTVKAAHCLCKAGLGEVCSHVAGTLFKMQTAVMMGLTEKSCTSKACEWNCQFKKKVEPSTMASVSNEAGLNMPPAVQRNPQADTIVQQELMKLLEFHDCALASSFPSDALPKKQDGELPYPLHKAMVTLKRQMEQGKTLSPEYCLQFLSKLPKMYPDHLLRNLEAATVAQSQSAVWKGHRHGRLTASVFGEVVHHVRGGRKSSSLVDKVICPPKLLRTEAVQWGIRHEDAAVEAALETIKLVHTGLKVRRSGLWVCSKAPYLAASPDGILSCDCCGETLLEVKCPFSVRNGVPQEASFLDENLMLKDDHKYMYQLQGQMMVTGMQCVFFCVYVPGQEPHILCIQRDESQIYDMCQKLEKFYVTEVMPHLVS